MEVIRAETLGFCPGVRRAVTMAEKAALDAKTSGRKAFVLGDIVHNPSVSAKLAALGVERLDNKDGSIAPERLAKGALAGSIVVIRSHGAAPDIVNAIIEAGADVMDATCPKVAANQRAAASQAKAGRLVVVVGDKGHGETLGVAGHAPGSIVVSSIEEAAALPFDRPMALVAQTTFSEEDYKAIKEYVSARQADLFDAGGICTSSRKRRAAIENFKGKVDALLVVGGRNSANTRRLAELAASLGIKTLHVENANEISDSFADYSIVGLSAGASTPDEDIDAAEARLLSLKKG